MNCYVTSAQVSKKYEMAVTKRVLRKRNALFHVIRKSYGVYGEMQRGAKTVVQLQETLWLLHLFFRLFKVASKSADVQLALPPTIVQGRQVSGIVLLAFLKLTAYLRGGIKSSSGI